MYLTIGQLIALTYCSALSLIFVGLWIRFVVRLVIGKENFADAVTMVTLTTAVLVCIVLLAVVVGPVFVQIAHR